VPRPCTRRSLNGEGQALGSGIASLVVWCHRRVVDDRDALAANSKLSDDASVAFDVIVADVVEEATALANQLHQATAGVVITLVELEVRSQVTDAVGQEGNLHL